MIETQFTNGHAIEREARTLTSVDPTVTLAAALLREKKLLRDKAVLLERQTLLAQEFEHRLVNGLQLVVSLLNLQIRTAPTEEVAAQLNAAATRVAAIGRVHRRLHLLDHEKDVAFKRYILELCDDLSGLLLQDQAGRTVVVTGVDSVLPVAFGISLGFIVNELVTNAVKYTQGNISVVVAREGAVHSLSVTDEGPGLPPDFDPSSKKGLGMNIIRSLVRQIGASMHFGAGKDHGTCVTIMFAAENAGRIDVALPA